MEKEALHQGRLAVTNPIDDTHETFKHLKDAGITEAQAEVFTETFKGLADQTMQVNENLLMVRDELRGEITGIRGELKDIHHNAASNYQKLDAKIDSNYQSLDHKIDTNQKKLETDIALVRKELASTNQEGIHTRETLSNTIESTRETLTNKIESTRETLSIQMDAKFAQALTSSTRWNMGILITMFLGFGGLIVALGGLIITLTAPLR